MNLIKKTHEILNKIFGNKDPEAEFDGWYLRYTLQYGNTTYYVPLSYVKTKTWPGAFLIHLN